MDDLETIWNGLTDDEKHAAMEIRNHGAPPEQAIRSVRQRNTAFNVQSAKTDAEVTQGGPGAGPTDAERSGAFGLSVANTVSNDAVPTAKKFARDIPAAAKEVGGALLNNPALGVAALPLAGLAPLLGPAAYAVENHLRPSVEGSAEDEAAAAAPESYGYGGYLGDAINALTGAPGLAKAAAAGGRALLARGASSAASKGGGLIGKVAGGAAKNAASKVIGSDAMNALTEAFRGEPHGPAVDPGTIARESWVRDLMPDAYGVAPEEAANLVGKKAAPRINFAAPVDDAPIPKAAPPAPSKPLARLLDVLESKAPRADMPADVMAAEVPKAVTAARPPKIGGTGEQLTAYVKNLPPDQRVAFIHRIAKDMGKDTAQAVADAARVSMKLNPL